MVNIGYKDCKDCIKREIACHDKCETYKEFKAKLEEKRMYMQQGIDAKRVMQEGYWRRCKG